MRRLLTNGLQHILSSIPGPIRPEQEGVQIKPPIHNIQWFRKHNNIFLRQIFLRSDNPFCYTFDNIIFGVVVMKQIFTNWDLIEEELELWQGNGLGKGKV